MLANKHAFTSLTCATLFGSILFILFKYYPLLLSIAPAAYAFITSFMIMRVFKKYNPEMDPKVVIEGR
ncbi:MAG: hypothetical protein IJO49_05995, partial [Clostridia bacterium]|nr:hypothetical protein [Clostridia bacterium]